MSQLELSRMDWQRAQADLQSALAELERQVASPRPDAGAIKAAREDIDRRQRIADDLLQRYITYIGKS